MGDSSETLLEARQKSLTFNHRKGGTMYSLQVIVGMNEASHRKYLENRDARLGKMLDQIPADVLGKLLVEQKTLKGADADMLCSCQKREM